MMPLALSIGRDYNNAKVELRQFDNFATLAEFIQAQQLQGGHVGPYLCAPMSNGRRCEADAQPTRLLALDFDKLAPEAPRRLCQVIEAADWRAMLWTTRSSTPAAPRVRIVFELDRGVDKSEYARVYRGLVRHLAEATEISLAADESCAKPEQPALLPQPNSILWMRTDSVPLDVDACIACDPAQKDAAPLPTSSPTSWAAERARVGLALGYLNSDGYEFWIRMGMVLHHASGGSDEGFTVWHDWSARGETYAGTEDCRYHWASFGDYPGRALGLGTLYAAAKEAGYEPQAANRPEVPPLEAYAEDLDMSDAESRKRLTLIQGAAAQDVAEDTREVIQLKAGKRADVADAVERVLAATGEVYLRGDRLVRLAEPHDLPKTQQTTNRAEHQLVVTPATATWILYRAAQLVRLERYAQREQEWLPTDLPLAVAEMVECCTARAYLSPLIAIATAPFLRDDLTVCDRPGYDSASGIYLADGDFDPLPEHPTQADAQAALKLILEPFDQMPFASDASQSSVPGARPHRLRASDPPDDSRVFLHGSDCGDRQDIARADAAADRVRRATRDENVARRDGGTAQSALRQFARRRSQSAVRQPARRHQDSLGIALRRHHGRSLR